MSSITTRSSSRSSRPIWRISRSATSCGPRIVQRAAGQSAISRRPSSNAATSWAAFAAPMPGTAAELQLRRAGQPGQAVVPGERVGGEVDAPTARACPSPTAARSARPRSAHPTPRRASRSRGRSATAARGWLGRARAGRVRPFVRPGHAIPPATIPGGRSGVPEARTTGARRFPPPSGPRGRRRAYRRGPHRPVNRSFTGLTGRLMARRPVGRAGRARSNGRPSRRGSAAGR